MKNFTSLTDIITPVLIDQNFVTIKLEFLSLEFRFQLGKSCRIIEASSKIYFGFDFVTRN